MRTSASAGYCRSTFLARQAGNPGEPSKLERTKQNTTTTPTKSGEAEGIESASAQFQAVVQAAIQDFETILSFEI